VTTIKLRRDPASQWVSNNPVLAAGEPGYELDTGQHKIGDGYTPWLDLDYFIPRLAVANLVEEVAGTNIPDLTTLFENGLY